MKSGKAPFVRRFVPLAVAGILVVALAACTGRGGGYLPPDGVVFKGQASFGFTFSCENGDLQIELAYNDKGSNPIGSSFGIHGTVDTLDPVVESAVCIGDNAPPPPENQLIFLGRYRLTSSAPSGFPDACETTTPSCRFEVIVQDNDQSLAPSPGDFFSIKLSTVTAPCPSDPFDLTCSQLPPLSVFYARAGLLAGGNLTVD
jgi:predicted small lipoprotein YifL